MNHPCITLTRNKTGNKLQRSFLDDMHKRSIDCKVMLHYDGKLNIGVKLGVKTEKLMPKNLMALIFGWRFPK